MGKAHDKVARGECRKLNAMVFADFWRLASWPAPVPGAPVPRADMVAAIDPPRFRDRPVPDNVAVVLNYYQRRDFFGRGGCRRSRVSGDE